MQLWYAPTSPFARKVRIAAGELGLAGRIELVRVDPWTDVRLRALNPLAKVPTLVRDDGGVLYESAVICDYLDALAPRRLLHPADGEARWRALLLQGLADGAATAAGRLYADERRPAHERSEAMMARFREAIGTSLDALDADRHLADGVGIGQVAVAAFVSYLDFRWPERDWREGRPRLAAWFDAFARRDSMTGTPYATAG
ncbi:glutathione S-transferase family protein [Fulvimonas soli]|jgi:glutathione S-transferase|uniref:Glutathione S-transferase n=1 Tax=Fulvimonas soli TaxID=155197 RepID=A0A316HZD3_9GAMM|nr:glutathione S-transferase N-terminal domain-containing protein [Fulvimonas soli]PWK86687.1 glutathione S-transferase [Fulvimonas soli]TNY25974.1 hypothetical protein BV497_11140 [Fulvimonas soli]